MVPDRYTRHEMIYAIPFWGFIYIIVFLLSFNMSTFVISDRMQLRENTDGITGSITLSRILAIAIIATFIKLIATESSQKNKQTIYIILSLVFCLLLLIAGQRGTLIGLGIALSALLLRKEWRHHSVAIASLAIIGILIAITFIDFSQFEIFQRFSEFQHIESFKRYEDYGKVWGIFQSNDFLWGLGSKGYMFKTGRPWPHNIILEHISDYGLAGLICILILLIVCIKYAMTLIRQSKYNTDLAIACGWIVLCFSAMVSSSMLNLSLFYTFTGLLVLTYQDFVYQSSEEIHEDNL
jgi:O-antigen ligase